MNPIRHLIPLCLLAALCLSAAPARAAALAGKLGALVDSYAEHGIFSGTVLVAKDGQPVYSAARGPADRAAGTPNQADTRHNIGSMGKTFTAVAVMQLAEAGKLRLDDPLGRHLPDLALAGKDTILLSHLLNHSSGLGSYMRHPEFRARKGQLREIADYLPLIEADRPAFAPGSRYSYSNSGMVLLGAVIEKASGMRYADYVRKHIFEPAGMRDSGYWREEEAVPNRSIGYLRQPDGSYADNVAQVPPPASDGGMRATAADLLKYDQALRGARLLSEASKQKMYTPSGPSAEYGYGWERRPVHGDYWLGHPGGTMGVQAELRRYAGSGYTVIVLSNMHQGARDLAEQIEALLYGKPVTLATRQYADYLYSFTLGRTDPRAALALLDKNADSHPPSLYAAARLRIENKSEPEKALALLDRYLALDPAGLPLSHAAAWWRKGNAFELLGKRAEARNSYERALALDATFGQARAALDKLGAAKD